MQIRMVHLIVSHVTQRHSDNGNHSDDYTRVYFN